MIAKFLVDLLGEEKGQGEMGEGRGRGRERGGYMEVQEMGMPQNCCVTSGNSGI